MKGYIGKMLFADPGTGNCRIEEIPDRVYEKVLSGAWLGAWYLCNNVPPKADPLDQTLEEMKINDLRGVGTDG